MADFDDTLRKHGPLPLPFIDRSSSASDCPSLPLRLEKKPLIYAARTLHEIDMCNLLATVRDQHEWARLWQDPDTRAKLAAEVQSTADDWDVRECDWHCVLEELDYQAMHEPTASAVDNVFVSDDSIPRTWLPTEFAVDNDGKVEIFSPVPLRIVLSPYLWYSHLPEEDQDAPSAFQVMNGWVDDREPLIPPPLTEFKSCTPLSLRGRTLKVVTKISSIHLAPVAPTFYGSNMRWSVDGTASDAIVATAIYFYDFENIPDSKLAFRRGVQRVKCDRDDRHGLDAVYRFKEWEPLVQECGAVTARPWRLVVYPDMFQHVWDDFTLVDKSREGHLKYVAFFLVDPSSAFGDLVVSTCRVPPQQADWVADAWAGPQRSFPPKIPREVVDMIVSKVGAVMTHKEALQLKHELQHEDARRAMLLDHSAHQLRALRARGPLPLPFIDRSMNWRIRRGVDTEELEIYEPRTLNEIDMCRLLATVRDVVHWPRQWQDPVTRAALVANLDAKARVYNMPNCNLQYVLDELDFQSEPDVDQNAPEYANIFARWLKSRVPEVPPAHAKFEECTPMSLRGCTLKVVPKISGIHLTPNHMEWLLDPETLYYGDLRERSHGMANDAIVAAAMYFYDMDNVSTVKMHFRCTIKQIECECDDEHGVEAVYGFENLESPLVQRCGYVTVHPGRLVVYPNTLLHAIDRFWLVDNSRPGYLKYVAFLLVDPSTRHGDEVISTSHVPPQQADWVTDAWAGLWPVFPPKVPHEVVDMIVNKVGTAMTRNEAKRLAREMVDEHSEFCEDLNELSYNGVLFRM
ncbi:hypothetical protein GGF32_009502 [Allomyces javanicus]|nr:hypothetical protein GGF32_009502 [Allomyces javanicus]